MTDKMFLSMDSGANAANMSIRNFLRHVQTDKIPVIVIGKRHFILGRDFNAWLRRA